MPTTQYISFQVLRWAKPHANSRAAQVLGTGHLYRVANLWVFMRGNIDAPIVYVLDKTSLEQLRACCRFVAGFQMYCFNYRLFGRNPERSYDRRQAFYDIISWIQSATTHCFRIRICPASVAKHIKSTIGAITTIIFNDKDIPELQAETRFNDLINDANEVLPGHLPFYNLLTNCGLYEDELLDFAYCFHCLPTADYGPDELLCKTVANMNDPSCHVYNANTLDNFLRYAKSYMLSHIVYHRGEEVKITAEPGYDYKAKRWYRNCCDRKYDMPPKAEWGRAWVEDNYEYMHLMEFWHLDAADSTHVCENLGLELKLQARTYKERLLANELTYVLKYGDVLSCEIKPSDLRMQINNGRRPTTALSMLSAKAENTKFGAKSRDIHAACDTVREPLTEIDRNTNVIAADIAGPVLRIPSAVLNRQLMELSAKLVPHGCTVATSQDVSSWSVNMPRKVMYEFSDILLTMCRGDDKMSIESIWKNLTLAINKRGISMKGRVTDGCIMGWTGCSDTILHANIVSYAINRAKERGIIRQTESATSFELIDDSVLALDLDDRAQDNVERIQRILDTIVEVYAELGFTIDKPKTIVSSIKMTFLNRVFTRGAEVLTPMKVFAKIDRELTRRFSSILEQIQSLFTSASSASQRGADPFVCYITAVCRALAIIGRVINLSEYNPKYIAYAARAPQSLFGWGFPSIISFLTTGRSDPLSAYIFEEVSMVNALWEGNPSEARIVSNRLNHMLDQPFRRIDPVNFMQAPTHVSYEGPPNPSNLAKEEFRRAAFKAADAPQIRAVLADQNDQAINVVVDKLLQSSKHDAALLETLYEALPNNIFKAMIDKASKHEVISLLIGARTRKYITDRIRRGDRRYLLYLPLLLSKEYKDLPPIRNAVWKTKSVREAFYDFLGYHVVNHTVPVPTDLLVQASKCPNATEVSNTGITPVPGETTCDAYWGLAHLPQHGIRVSPMSRQQMVLRGYIPGVRKLMCAYTMLVSADPSKGGIVQCWLMMLSHLWTGGTTLFDDVQLPKTAILNTKSLLSTSRTLNATIFAMPNTLGMIEVNNTAVHAYLSRQSTRHHSIQIVQELRCAAILDALMGRFPVKTTRYYVIDVRNVMRNDSSICIGVAPDNIEADILRLSPLSLHSPELCSAIEVAMTNLPHYESGELVDFAHPQMRLDAEITTTHPSPYGASADIGSLAIGPISLRTQPVGAVQAADVRPSSSSGRQPPVWKTLEQLDYMTDTVSAMITLLRHQTLRAFNFAIVSTHATHTVNEVLYATGVRDVDGNVRKAWSAVTDLLASRESRRRDVAQWVHNNMDTEGNTSMQDAIMQPTNASLQVKKYWCYRMLMSHSMLIPFESDLAEWTKRDTQSVWERYAESVQRQLTGPRSEMWILVYEMLVDPIWHTIVWSSFASFHKVVANTMARFIKRHTSFTTKSSFHADATLEDIYVNLFNTAQPHDELRDRYVGTLYGNTNARNIHDAITELATMFLKVRYCLAHTPSPSLTPATVGTEMDGAPMEDIMEAIFPEMQRHVSEAIDDITFYNCCRLAQGLTCVAVSATEAKQRIEQVMEAYPIEEYVSDTHGNVHRVMRPRTRIELWDYLRLYRYLEEAEMLRVDEHSYGRDVRPQGD